MKRVSFFLLLALFLTGCGPTSIVTVSPGTYQYHAYATSVSYPRTGTVQTTAHVVAADDDISLSLDLQAVGAAFAQSTTVQNFENLLNNSQYMLSNLDLNNDGYVDYLRVLESVDGHNHVFVIQAVLGDNIYQDVATVIAELPSVGTPCVQIVGNSYLYGHNYIIQPVFVTTPRIYVSLRRVGYCPWHSPWYWNHYPSYYHCHAPVYLGHYQAYITTYMSNHHYCHGFDYVTVCHYPGYVSVSRSVCRNDYGRLHPEHSFAQRNAGASRYGGGGSRTASIGSESRGVVNARDVRDNQKKSTVTTVTTTRRSSSASVPASSTTVRSSVRSSGTASTSVSRSGGSSSSARSSSSSARSASSTSVSRSDGSSSSARSASSTSVSRSGGSSSSARSSSSTGVSRSGNGKR